ncbi:MAG: hypothetical protein IJ840_03460 [Bacteroidales bacterium]|nr:hypothetical protein [Bacteroidales bacterium]
MRKINELIDGYFEGTLTQGEEDALKIFLASEDGQDPEYDEVRAVMGFFAAGRHTFQKSALSLPKGEGKSVVWRRVAAVAASLAIIVTLGVSLYNNKSNICVSFVGGRKVTDKAVVMNDVDNILADLLSDRTDMEEILNDFFDR